MRSLRTTAIMALLFIVGACTINLKDIRRTEPVRTVNYTGSFEEMALCVEARLGGKWNRDLYKPEISIYDSVKAHTNRGVSHYAMTITQTDKKGGFVVWQKIPEGEMDQFVVDRFWSPVVACAEEVGRQADPGESAAL
ncbi:MAG: hypothetical protein QNJ67_16710 [Kiloniellales bacterium]|nr:hypothetical protein [Kiloniellales bacterium]